MSRSRSPPIAPAARTATPSSISVETIVLTDRTHPLTDVPSWSQGKV